MKIYDAFISYRRSDGLLIAEALYKYLTSKGLRVFFDKNEMIDGHYFTFQIKNNLIMAPNYILIATDDVFKFREGEDWVRNEIEVAIKEYENSPTERNLTVLVPEKANFPEKECLPESVCDIADAQRIFLPYGEDFADAFYKTLRSVTNINRRNLWFAAHRWLENSKQSGGRFANLSINESILPNASAQKKEQKYMPINVYRKNNENEIKLPLFEAVSQTQNSFYLIGQGGIGKTTALMHIMNNAYEGKQYSENAQIPLFVELSFAPDTNGALYEGGKSSFIRRSIFKQVRADRTIKQVTAKEVSDVDEVFASLPYDVAVKPITDILSKTSPDPEYLLLLDGLNEVSSVTIEETGKSVVQMIMREIDLLLTECPNVRIVLTSRSDESALCSDSISRLYLSGIEEETIKRYLESCDFSKEAIDKISGDESLFETLQIPLFLTMYASLSKCDEASTQGEILKLFFNERRKNISVYTMQQRLAEVEKNVTEVASASQEKRIDADMQNFILDFILPEIAWQMERNDEFYLRVREIRRIIEPILTETDDISVCGVFGREIFTKYRSGASAKVHTYKVAKKILERLGDDITEVTESVINCSVFAFGIMQESGGKYGFAHQHIRDYFVAVKNINTLRLSVYLYEENEKKLALECMNKTFKDEPVNYTVRKFMGEYLCEHRNKPYYASEKWNYGVPSEKCDRNLLKRALDIYRGYFDGECGYGIYSLITILKEIRTDLSGDNLSNLDFSMCNLNGIIFFHKDLISNFNNSILSSKNLLGKVFDYKSYRNKFYCDKKYLFDTNSRKTEIYDLETNNYIVNLEGEFINSIENEYIITRSDRGYLLWNPNTFVLVKIIENFQGTYSECSPSGKCICTLSKSKGVTIWDALTNKATDIAVTNSNLSFYELLFDKKEEQVAFVWDKSENNKAHYVVEVWNIKNSFLVGCLNCDFDKDHFTTLRFLLSEKNFLAFYYDLNKKTLNAKIFDLKSFDCKEYNTTCDDPYNFVLVFDNYIFYRAEYNNFNLIRSNQKSGQDAFSKKKICAVDPNGKFLIMKDADYNKNNVLEIFDVETGSFIKKLTHKTRIYTKISDNGKYMVSYGNSYDCDGEMKIWNTGNFECIIEKNNGMESIRDVEFSVDYNQLITKHEDTYDNTVFKIWSFPEMIYLGSIESLSPHISIIDCSFDGEFVAINSNDNSLKIWKTDLFEIKGMTTNNRIDVSSIGRHNQKNLWMIENLVFVPYSRILVGEFTENFRDITYILDMYTTNTLMAGYEKVNSIGSGGKFILTSNGHDINLFNVEKRESNLIKIPPKIYFPYKKTFINNDGTIYIFQDKSIVVWNPLTQNISEFEFDSKNYDIIAFNPTKKEFCTAVKRSSTITIWDANEIKIKAILKHVSSDKSVWMKVMYSANGNYIVTHHGKTLKIWDTQKYLCRRTLFESDWFEDRVKFDQAGRLFCYSLSNGIQVYDENFNYIHTIETDCENLALSLKYIFVSYSNIINVFCSKTFKKIKTLYNVNGVFIRGVDFSNLHPKSSFSEEEKEILHQYGAIID